MKKSAFLILLLACTVCLFGQYSKVVAIGDSLTAGYSSGSLVETYQETSYPALVARQLGIQPFEQPLVSEPGIPAMLQLHSLLQGAIISPTILPVTMDPAEYGLPLNLQLARPYDNLAVPGATLNDVLSTVDDGGGMHSLILRGLGTQVEQAIALSPDLLLVWAGNNDALGAALMGTAIPGVTLTPTDAFAALYGQLISTLTANTSADIVVMTVPDVTTIPFVTAVAPYILNPETGEVVVDQHGAPVTFLGENDEGGLSISPDTYVLLTASQYIAQGYGIPAQLGGTGLPLPPEVLLTPSEVATIREHVNAFNASITSVAAAEGCAVFDTHGFFSGVAHEGIEIAGIEINADFLTGGFMSYDGVHPNSIGYAIATNYLIDVINDTFGAEIEPVGLAPFFFSTLCCPGTTGLNSFQVDGLEATVDLLTRYAHEKTWEKKQAR